MRALVIDDDPTILEMLQVVLGLEGFEVVAASDGAAGLRQARDERPDVIVLDVMMPAVDGWAVVEQLRSEPGLCDVPVVFCTALADEESQWRGWRSGATSFVTKPFDNDRLVAEVLRAAHAAPAVI